MTSPVHTHATRYSSEKAATDTTPTRSGAFEFLQRPWPSFPPKQPDHQDRHSHEKRFLDRDRDSKKRRAANETANPSGPRGIDERRRAEQGNGESELVGQDHPAVDQQDRDENPGDDSERGAVRIGATGGKTVEGKGQDDFYPNLRQPE